MINKSPTGTCTSIISPSGCDNASVSRGKKKEHFRPKTKTFGYRGRDWGLLEEESVPQFYLYLPRLYSLPSLHPFVKQVHCHTFANFFEVYRSSMFTSDATFSDAGQASQGPCWLGKALSLDFF